MYVEKENKKEKAIHFVLSNSKDCKQKKKKKNTNTKGEMITYFTALRDCVNPPITSSFAIVKVYLRCLGILRFL